MEEVILETMTFILVNMLSEVEINPGGVNTVDVVLVAPLDNTTLRERLGLKSSSLESLISRIFATKKWLFGPDNR